VCGIERVVLIGVCCIDMVGLIGVLTTFTPAIHSPSATAEPRPPVAPVTMAVLFSRL
jgi:hypothetical protein